MKNKRFIILLSIVAVLLLIPYVAMQFTGEVDWDIFDFIIMGILLLGTISIGELIIRKVKTKKVRLILCGVVFFLFLFIWAELAVGIVGSPFTGS